MESLHFLAKFLLLCLLFCAQAHVPALFAFGDSEVDTGNNNYLNTSARANYLPYGIDYPNHNPTGRYSNNLLLVDYIASLLDLPSPPIYYQFRTTHSYPTGANFASGTSGVLPETHIGASMVLSDQVSAFKRVHEKLISTFGQKGGLHIVKKSIYFFSTTTNDINNANLSIGVPYDRIISAYILQIEILYNLGARKFIVFGAIANGCIPLNIVNGTCGVAAQKASRMFNTKFKRRLKYLHKKLKKITIVQPDYFKLMVEVNLHPKKYGFANATAPCCQLSSNLVTCQPGGTYCVDRSKYAYWDAIHNTDKFYKMAAILWWSGSSSDITPINIQQLAVI